MAYTFPMPLNQFFDGLPITVFSFDLGEALEMNETGGGEILTADMGNRLWQMDCEIKPGYYADIKQIKAKLDVLRYAGRSLLVHALGITAPQSDPDGSILGASVPVLNAVQPNNREIRLGGLPNGYVITTGDYLAFQYGSNPVRYAFHQVANGATAPGGVSGLIELSSFVRPGYALGAPIQLIKPTMKMIVRPGSVDPGRSGGRFTTGVKFSLVQTLR